MLCGWRRRAARHSGRQNLEPGRVGWEYEAAPVSGSYAIQDLEFVSDGVWWAATNHGGRIYVSSSASSWSELDQISGRTSVTALCRVSDSLAFAGADGRMYKSTDDGASWALLQDLGAAINRIEALSDGTVLAACNDGKVYRGGTLYTAFSHEDAVDAVARWRRLIGDVDIQRGRHTGK